MRKADGVSGESPRKRAFHRLAAAAIAAVVALFGVLTSPSPAHADDSSCGLASGGGYACTYVAGSGTWVSHVWSNRFKAFPAEICRSSAWAYYIPPWGGAVGLAYTSRNDCVYGMARAYMNVKRHVPAGSRVCAKFMEFDQPVGPEPCIVVR
jgi:hypothetical protein